LLKMFVIFVIMGSLRRTPQLAPHNIIMVHRHSLDHIELNETN
jgi:hypothetical protein